MIRRSAMSLHWEDLVAAGKMPITTWGGRSWVARWSSSAAGYDHLGEVELEASLSTPCLWTATATLNLFFNKTPFQTLTLSFTVRLSNANADPRQQATSQLTEQVAHLRQATHLIAAQFLSAEHELPAATTLPARRLGATQREFLRLVMQCWMEHGASPSQRYLCEELRKARGLSESFNVPAMHHRCVERYRDAGLIRMVHKQLPVYDPFHTTTPTTVLEVGRLPKVAIIPLYNPEGYPIGLEPYTDEQGCPRARFNLLTSLNPMPDPQES